MGSKYRFLLPRNKFATEFADAHLIALSPTIPYLFSQSFHRHTYISYITGSTWFLVRCCCEIGGGMEHFGKPAPENENKKLASRISHIFHPILMGSQVKE
jgi:hypothetical protein